MPQACIHDTFGVVDILLESLLSSTVLIDQCNESICPARNKNGLILLQPVPVFLI